MQTNTLILNSVIIATLFLTSCSDYDRENFRMEVGKRYDLKKWPDSAYIDTLDKFFKNEPIKQSQKQQAEITMSMNNNFMNIPKKEARIPEKNIPEKKSPKETIEPFPDRFVNALNKLLENPSSRELGKKYNVKNGETLDNLLLRVYGQQAKRLPKYTSELMVKQLNPGVDFSALSEGEMVLLPIVN
jgi:hypothetical protein